MQETNQPWYKTPLVWMLIFIPMSAVIMGIVMITIAVKTDDGLVKDDYYKHGKNINKSIKRDKAAIKLGLSASLKFDHKTSTITGTVTSSTDYQLPEFIKADLLHATISGNDQVVSLQRTPTGVYFSAIPALADGHWIVQLSADEWRMNGHLYKPGDTVVNIDTSKQ